MTTATLARPSSGSLRLSGVEGSHLFLPALQPTPLPLRAIEPSPCTQACPAGINVKAYISLIAEGRFREALDEVRRRCPLPGICGRVCHAPCEEACNRGDSDEPVAIRSLKRFLADLEAPPRRSRPTRPADRKERVAVIGAGPAGLTAAYDLRRAGYPVTIFEGEDEPGGMLRYGIAAYRLPRNVLSAEIEAMLCEGLDLRTGVRLGRDVELEKLLGDEFRAVLLATGAPNGRHLGLSGEPECDDVEDALAFLRRVNRGEREAMPKNVLVIGGGSTAIEAARTAKRLGAESVQILYRRSPEEVLASREEVEAAEAEGVTLRYLVAPKRLLLDGTRLRGLECLKVGLGDFDASGRRRPIPIPGTEFPVKAERLLAAVGQQVDLGFLPSKGRTSLLDHGGLKVDRSTAMTRLTGVFAAGDLVTGPATVIEAIAAGHRAATSIRRLLEDGRPDSDSALRPAAPREWALPDVPPAQSARQRPVMRAPRRGREFDEVEQVLTKEQAIAEARRCQRCGPCSECRACVSSCQRRHLVVRTANGTRTEPPLVVRAPMGTVLPLASEATASGWILEDGASAVPDLDTSGGVPVEVHAARAHILAERCRGCGSCVEVCSFGAVSVTPQDGSGRAHIEPGLCRGCNLCAAVCPTDAVQGASLPEGSAVLGDLGRDAARLILSCDKRASTEKPPAVEDGLVRRVRVRCLGEVEAGLLVELVRRGAAEVRVDACAADRCHYGKGATLARNAVAEARALLRLLGWNEERIRLGEPRSDSSEPITAVVESTEHPTPQAAGGHPWTPSQA